MKKLLLTSCCSAALALSSFGQGYINWGTISPTYCTFQTNTTQYSTLSELGNGASKSGGTTDYTVSGGATVLHYSHDDPNERCYFGLKLECGYIEW